METIESQYQHVIVRQTIWKRFDVIICRCTVCHQRVHGPHPRQTSDAFGVAVVQVGPDALALAVTMNKRSPRCSRTGWRRDHSICASRDPFPEQGIDHDVPIGLAAHHVVSQEGSGELSASAWRVTCTACGETEYYAPDTPMVKITISR